MGGYVTGTRHHLLQEGARTITVGRGRPAAAAHPELAPVLLRLLRCGDEDLSTVAFVKPPLAPDRFGTTSLGIPTPYLTSTVTMRLIPCKSHIITRHPGKVQKGRGAKSGARARGERRAVTMEPRRAYAVDGHHASVVKLACLCARAIECLYACAPNLVCV